MVGYAQIPICTVDPTKYIRFLYHICSLLLTATLKVLRFQDMARLAFYEVIHTLS
jgi:hypothetical protein